MARDIGPLQRAGDDIGPLESEILLDLLIVGSSTAIPFNPVANVSGSSSALFSYDLGPVSFGLVAQSPATFTLVYSLPGLNIPIFGSSSAIPVVNGVTAVQARSPATFDLVWAIDFGNLPGCIADGPAPDIGPPFNKSSFAQ